MSIAYPATLHIFCRKKALSFLSCQCAPDWQLNLIVIWHHITLMHYFYPQRITFTLSDNSKWTESTILHKIMFLDVATKNMRNITSSGQFLHKPRTLLLKDYHESMAIYQLLSHANKVFVPLTLSIDQYISFHSMHLSLSRFYDSI